METLLETYLHSQQRSPHTLSGTELTLPYQDVSDVDAGQVTVRVKRGHERALQTSAIPPRVDVPLASLHRINSVRGIKTDRLFQGLSKP